jgi:hypothetical protein
MTNANDDPRIGPDLDEQLYHAAEELITGDSDDPPLSEEAVVEMLRLSRLYNANSL